MGLLSFISGRHKPAKSVAVYVHVTTLGGTGRMVDFFVPDGSTVTVAFVRKALRMESVRERGLDIVVDGDVRADDYEFQAHHGKRVIAQPRST